MVFLFCWLVLILALNMEILHKIVFLLNLNLNIIWWQEIWCCHRCIILWWYVCCNLIYCKWIYILFFKIPDLQKIPSFLVTCMKVQISFKYMMQNWHDKIVFINYKMIILVKLSLNLHLSLKMSKIGDEVCKIMLLMVQVLYMYKNH